MLLLFEKGIQGGITRTVKHYDNTNNKYEVNLYNHEDLIRFLVFLDANFYACTSAWEKKANDFTSEKIS